MFFANCRNFFAPPPSPLFHVKRFPAPAAPRKNRFRQAVCPLLFERRDAAPPRRRGVGRALQKRSFPRFVNAIFYESPRHFRAGEVGRALRERPFPCSANANFYESPRALRTDTAWGAFQKRGMSATFLSGTRGVSVAFTVIEPRSRRFGVFSSFCPCPTCGLPIQRAPALRAIRKTRRSGANTAADCFCRRLCGNVARGARTV